MLQEKNFKLTHFERLNGRKRIEELYAKGHSFYLPAIRVKWIFHSEEEAPFNVQVMFTAPKKKFKKAVTRNRLRRLMREAYRKNKHLLYDYLEKEKQKIHLSIVFTGEADITYAQTEGKIILTLQRLIQEIKSSSPK